MSSAYHYYNYKNFEPKPKHEEDKAGQLWKSNLPDISPPSSEIPKPPSTSEKPIGIMGNLGNFLGLGSDKESDIIKDNISISDTDLIVKNTQENQVGGFRNLNMVSDNLSHENIDIRNILKKNRELHSRIQALEKQLYLRNERY